MNSWAAGRRVCVPVAGLGAGPDPSNELGGLIDTQVAVC
jgi:hypothetical protein